MGNKKRGKIPPIIKDYQGYHITHTYDNKGNHTGKISVYAGKNKKKDGFKTIDDAVIYIDKLSNKIPNIKDELRNLDKLIEQGDMV